MDVGHVDIEDDEVGLQRRDDVLEVKVVEDRRIAGHTRVDDLDAGAARALAQACFQALGHRFGVGEAAAFGERVAEDGDAEDADGLGDGELAVTQAAGVGGEARPPHDTVEVRPQPVVKQASILDELVPDAVTARLLEPERDFDEHEPDRTPEHEEQDEREPPVSRGLQAVTWASGTRSRRARRA